MILVTGATGNVGREVVKLLRAGGHEVAAVTRHPATAVLPPGTHIVAGDPSAPQSIASALRGVQALLLSPRALGQADGDRSGPPNDAPAQLLQIAAQHGVSRIVLLSAVTVQHAGGDARFADAFKAMEDAVSASGLQWTFLRSTDYATNALAWAPQIRASGIVRGAYGDAATSTIHERDIAAVAVRALTSTEHAGHAYVLSGPQSLTQRERVRLIGEAVGRPLAWEEIPAQQVRQFMIAQGMPADVPDRMLAYMADRVHQPGPSSNTVADLLGRPALTFAEWAAENAAAFRA